MVKLVKKNRPPQTVQDDAPQKERKRSIFGASLTLQSRSRSVSSKAPLVASDTASNPVPTISKSSVPPPFFDSSSINESLTAPPPYVEAAPTPSPPPPITGRSSTSTRTSAKSVNEARRHPRFVAARNDLSAAITGEKALHSLNDFGDEDYADKSIDPADHILGRLSRDTWERVMGYLPRTDIANFLFATRKLRGQPLEAHLPLQLYCFCCACYHRRTEPGDERLRPSFVSNPPFDCPNALHMYQPRTRLVEGRHLPFSLVQLAARAQRYGPAHGVPLSALSRSWRCQESAWRHSSKVHVWKGHMIMRVVSQTFVKPQLSASEERLLLFSRNDYVPYFSCCDHWTHGRLIELVKCTLSHTPIPRQGLRDQLKEKPKVDFERLKTPNYMPKGCEDCKPMRRCPSCPTEYMFELKLVEDPRAKGLERFKHALVVTRWSDLGDGTSPSSPEWAACNGDRMYDSFAVLKTLSLCSAFEASTNNFTPNQRLMSLENGARASKAIRGDALTDAY